MWEQFLVNPRSWLEALTDTKATFSGAPNFAFGLTANKVLNIEALYTDQARSDILAQAH